MIRDYAAAIAAQMKVKLSKITVIDGMSFGCLDAHLLQLTVAGQIVNVLLYQSELDELQRGFVSDDLELKIRSSLSQFQLLFES
jgi:hypothetical protein